MTIIQVYKVIFHSSGNIKSSEKNKEFTKQEHVIRAAVSTSPLARGYWILGPG